MHKLQNLLFQKEKYEFNKAILDQINKKQFNQAALVNKFGNDEISKKLELNSIDDVNKFEVNSIEILYSSTYWQFYFNYMMIKDNIFVAKILSYEDANYFTVIQKNLKLFLMRQVQKIEIGILKSYDYLLNDKYKVIVNEKTLERVKNYFRWY